MTLTPQVDAAYELHQKVRKSSEMLIIFFLHLSLIKLATWLATLPMAQFCIIQGLSVRLECVSNL